MKIDSASSKMSTGCHNKQMDLSGKGGHSMEVISKKIGTPPGMMHDKHNHHSEGHKAGHGVTDGGYGAR